jgi:hypothetical protein
MELKKQNDFGKSKCACCGYFTISEIAETCAVCYWEENIYQEENTDDSDAPNYVSLEEAKINFIKYGAKKPELIDRTRKPYPEETE